jgi:hypothetical protein
LAAQLGHLDDFDAAKEVAYLLERGLLFQEGERLLSLVLPHMPPSDQTLSESTIADEVMESGTGVRDSAPIST